MEATAASAEPSWKPDVEFLQQALGFRVGNYGLTKWSQLFTARQLVALATFSGLVQEARTLVRRDAVAAGFADDGCGLEAGGQGASAYADAAALYLAFTLDRLMQQFSTLAVWSSNPAHELVVNMFSRQTLSMTWDFGEVNPFCAAASWEKCLDFLVKPLGSFALGAALVPGVARQADAQVQSWSQGRVVSTDPPYFDNIGYADLSDYFYVWLRQSLRPVFPELFATLSVPKAEELVATPFRHGGKDQAETFFLDGMSRAMRRIAAQSQPAFPVTIYYAFKQVETEITGTASTGWEAFLDAVIQAGFALTGTWPMHTERQGRMRDHSSNALASSIILVCRPRLAGAPSATRREFAAALRTELPAALAHLQRGNIAPVDLAQAAIGPGMAVYTRYSQVLDAEGRPVPVREALTLINQTLDEALAEQEGDFDSDTRFSVAWFEQLGFTEGEFGLADVLARAKNTSVQGMKEAGLLDPRSKGGKVRLLKPSELPEGWDPEQDPRLTVWESVHHLVRALEAGGESAAAALVKKLGSKAEVARELAYRLYTVCERKKRAVEALSYNALVQSWPEITRLAREGAKSTPAQRTFGEDEE